MESNELIYFLTACIMIAVYFTIKANLSLIKEKRYNQKLK